MTWTAPNGTTPFGSVHNVTSFTGTTLGVGDLVLLIVTNHTISGVWCNGVSSSRITWTQVVPTQGPLTNTNLALDGAPETWFGNAFAGTVNSTGSDTVTLSWVGGSTPSFTNAVAYEFHSTVGSWSADTFTTLNTNTGTNTWPSLTPAGSGELYYGFAWNSSSAATPGSNPDGNGFHYNANADTTNNGAAYNLSYPSGTSPVWGDSTEDWGLMMLMTEGTLPPVSQMPPQVPVYYQQRIQ